MKNSAMTPPTVAVLGHVDHGKSSLLDYIRKSEITKKEHGGITQHIGAYQVEFKSRKITFIDTPGHEAFGKLRSRGAKVADIALLVIAADDSVKPQTIESIKYIKEAQIPMIVAINKIDLPNINIEKVKRDLLQYEVILEEKGGKIAVFPVSAKTGKGIDDLLEGILLVAELKKINADAEAPFAGVIIESKLDKGRGRVATVLVKQGTLKPRQEIITEDEKVSVRALFDENGQSVLEAGPGKPVEVLGFNRLPKVGSLVNDKTFQENSRLKNLNVAPAPVTASPSASLLNVIVKADAYGSLEAIVDGLSQKIQVIDAGLGEINENDITKAKNNKAFILGFNIRLAKKILRLAADERVKIKIYQTIYKLFDEIDEVIAFIEKGAEKEVVGTAKILQEFLVSEGKIAGCRVESGRVAQGDKVRLLRNREEILLSRIKSLRLGKEKVNRAEKGQECGIRLSDEFDFKPGDVLESYLEK